MGVERLRRAFEKAGKDLLPLFKNVYLSRVDVVSQEGAPAFGLSPPRPPRLAAPRAQPRPGGSTGAGGRVPGAGRRRGAPGRRGSDGRPRSGAAGGQN